MLTEDDKTKIIICKDILKESLLTRLEELPSDLGDFLFNSAILSGGAITSVLNKELVNDYDLYMRDKNLLHSFNCFLDRDDVVSKVKSYTEDYNNVSSEMMYDNNNKIRDDVLITANAVSFDNDLQVITLHPAEEIKSAFDFVHCLPRYDIRNDKLFISELQYRCITTKTLILNNVNCETKRLLKFTNRGWKLNENNETF